MKSLSQNSDIGTIRHSSNLKLGLGTLKHKKIIQYKTVESMYKRWFSHPYYNSKTSTEYMWHSERCMMKGRMLDGPEWPILYLLKINVACLFSPFSVFYSTIFSYALFYVGCFPSIETFVLKLVFLMVYQDFHSCFPCVHLFVCMFVYSRHFLSSTALSRLF